MRRISEDEYLLEGGDILEGVLYRRIEVAPRGNVTVRGCIQVR